MQEPQQNTKLRVEKFVAAGGGPKGQAYPAALAVCEQYLDFTELKEVYGTSAGAITALALALGMDARSIQATTDSFNFTAFLDEDSPLLKPLQADMLQTANKLGSGKSAGTKLKRVVRTFKTNWKELLRTHAEVKARIAKRGGIFDGHAAKQWLQRLIAQHIDAYDHHMTFAELARLHEQHPTQYRKLVTVAYDPASQKAQVFSAEQTPNTPVFLGVYASMCLPTLWPPQADMVLDADRILVKHSDRRFTDGGVVNNYPFDLAAGENTVGLFLTTTEDMAHYLGEASESASDTSSTVFSRMFSNFGVLPKQVVTQFKLQNARHFGNPKEVANTIHICLNGSVSTFSFDLDNAQRRHLASAGALAAQQFFSEAQHSLSAAAPSTPADDAAQTPAAPADGAALIHDDGIEAESASSPSPGG